MATARWTKRDVTDVKRWLTSRTRYWFRKLELHHDYYLEIIFGPLEGRGYGACEFSAEYRWMRVYYDVDRIPEREDLELLVVHELTHGLIGALHRVSSIGRNEVETRLIDDQGERVCHDISRLLLKFESGRDPHPRIRVISKPQSPATEETEGNVPT